MSELNEISAAAVEASLPSFTKKLEELKKGLSPGEQAVLSSIVNSAALHAKAMQPISHSATTVSVRVNGGIGVTRGDRNPNDQARSASPGVREHLIRLADIPGLTEASTLRNPLKI